MKKLNLTFRKKVISLLSGKELSKVQGGNMAFSYNSCPTVDGPCTATSECTDLDSWQGKCFSDKACGSISNDPVLEQAPEKHPSDYCQIFSDNDNE